MKELEASLGFSLLHRSTHGLVLTDAGEGLFQHCLQMLAALDDYVVQTRNLQTGPFGTLRVQATSDYARSVLAPLIVTFVKNHPGLRVHLSIVPDNSVPTEDSFDVTVAQKKPSLPGLTGQDLGEVRHVICASPAYFQQFGRPKKPQELRDHNCLADLYSGPKDWPFKNASRPLLVEVKGSLSSNSHAVLIQMALHGCGIIRVPLDAVKAELADKRLEAIFQKIALSPEHMWAYFAKGKNLPAKTSEFIDFLEASLRRDRGSWAIAKQEAQSPANLSGFHSCRR